MTPDDLEAQDRRPTVPGSEAPAVPREADVPQVVGPVKRQKFNGWFEAKDPVEFLGTPLTAFRQNFSWPLPDAVLPHAQELRSALYQEVEQRVRSGRRGSSDGVSIDFVDARHVNDSRRYFRLASETVRGTRTTTLFRCYVYGTGNLYFALDSFVLQGVSTRKVAIRVALTLVALLVFLANRGGFVGLLAFLVFALVSWFCWGQVARAARSEGTSNAMRAVFPQALADSSFDLDDTLMHLKSTLPSIMDALAVVGPQYGLDMRSLDEMVAELTKNVRSGTGIVVNNHGSMSGVVVGGSGNLAGGGKS